MMKGANMYIVEEWLGYAFMNGDLLCLLGGRQSLKATCLLEESD